MYGVVWRVRTGADLMMSIMDEEERIVRLTCIYTACKAEENHVSTEELGTGIEQDPHEIMSSMRLLSRNTSLALTMLSRITTVETAKAFQRLAIESMSCLIMDGLRGEDLLFAWHLLSRLLDNRCSSKEDKQTKATLIEMEVQEEEEEATKWTIKGILDLASNKLKLL
uniref:Uncharacterized protein n=1 Tax=Tanacetum cinerariifolium TaxID=118510 RepID=A0A6L2LFX9_TANCI|nr:hypothetical protein [Tanacetum cinerariifolium]